MLVYHEQIVHKFIPKFLDLIKQTKNTHEQLEKLRALIVILIKLQKNGKLQKKKSKF